MFTVMLHMGTLISVFIVYWKDIVELFRELIACIKDIGTGKGPRINANPTRKLGFMIIVATIPTALIGFLFNDTFESFYSKMWVIGIGLLLTGAILWAAEKFGKNDKDIEEMSFVHAIIVGVMQGLAITPGVSRSGSTLFGGLISGLNREFAVRFAFLISIPSILGSFVLELPGAVKAGMQGTSLGPILLGVLVAAVSGFVAIKAMIKIVSGKKLTMFSYYVWTLGILVILYSILF